MLSANDLKQLLFSINHKSYPAYKSTRGAYQFPRYTLSIDHVQGDPFAAPSRVSVHINGKTAAFPTSLYGTYKKRVALQETCCASLRARSHRTRSARRAPAKAVCLASAAAARKFSSALPAF